MDDKPEPASTAAQVREEIAHQERRVTALEAAIGEAQNELVATIEANRPAWSRDAIRETSKARVRYESSLAELEASRENLSSAVGLFGWASSGGQASAEPATNRLAGSTGGRGFVQVMEVLRADLEHLAGFDSLEREQPVRVAFERISRVLG